MEERKRAHRPDPARIRPQRNLSKLWQSSGTATAGANPADSISGGQAQSGLRGTDPVGEGVTIAYRVIERYITEGRRAAEQFNKRPYDRKVSTDDVRELFERIVRLQSEMVPLWIEALSTFARSEASAVASPANGHATPHAKSTPPSTPTTISLEIISTRPARVSLELRPSADGRGLMTHGLRALDPNKPVLTDITFLPSQDHSCGTVRVVLPKSQPPGIYSGVIVDRERGESCGTLSVHIAG
jgi:hypothetical protein